MKAIVCTRYGPPDVLQLADLAKPVPTDNFGNFGNRLRFLLHRDLYLAGTSSILVHNDSNKKPCRIEGSVYTYCLTGSLDRSIVIAWPGSLVRFRKGAKICPSD
jgi:hypothetical protein